MNKYKIKWVNTGRIEILCGIDLKHAFECEGISMWYGTDKYVVL